MPCSRSASSKRSRVRCASGQQPLHLAPDGYQLRSRAHPIRAPLRANPPPNCAARPATRTNEELVQVGAENRKELHPAPTTGWFHPRPPSSTRRWNASRLNSRFTYSAGSFQVHRRHSGGLACRAGRSGFSLHLLGHGRWLPHLLCGSTTFATKPGLLAVTSSIIPTPIAPAHQTLARLALPLFTVL